ncbi:MAG: aspartyl protease family protein [Rhizomicrobium sp.]
MRAPLAGLFVLLLSAPASAAAPITVPFDMIGNQLFVAATVDGKGPFRFLLDTGAVDVVAQRLTVQLGLALGGALPVHGAGDSAVQGAVVTVPSVDVGGAILTGERFYVLSLDPIEALGGVHVDGILGYEFFRRYVTRFDFAAHTITLTDPGAFKPDGAGTAIPMTSTHNTPEIAGSYDGIPATFDIDTGDNGGLTLTTPFVTTHGLRDRPGKHVDVVAGYGVGGETYARIVRGGELVLGTVPAGHPVTDLSANAGGVFGAGAFSGNIGIEVVRRFAMTLDYVHGTLYLEPRADPVGDLDSYDRAGMAIIPNPAGFEIYAVTSGGPAEAAGIVKGDIITAVDGVPATAITLSAIHQRQRSDPPGTVLHLTLASGKRVDVTLRDQI